MPTAAAAPRLTRCERTEKWLQRRKIKFTGPTLVELDEIDMKGSEVLQAREEAFDQETVDRYCNAYRAGEELPPVVLTADGLLASGMHRTRGLRKAGGTEISAYRLAPETDSATIRRVAFAMNSTNGKPVPLAHRLRQAVMMIADGQETEAVAEDLQLTTQQVRDAIKGAKAGNRAARLGCGRAFDSLAQTAKVQLGSIKSDPVFLAAARMVIETSFGAGKELAEFVRDVRAAASEGDALDLVEQTRAQRTAPKPKREVLYSPVNHLYSSGKGLLNLDPAALAAQLVADSDRSETLELVRQLAYKCMEIEEALA